MLITTGLAARPLLTHRHVVRPMHGGSPSYTMPLDIQNGTSAWGLYQLRTAYTANLLKVRRSSDNTTQDVGFVSSTGALDTAALLSFCGSGDGFIDTLYDQTGNARNWTQATQANQPQIVSSGAVITGLGGLPSVQFDGTNDGLAGSGLQVLLTVSEGTVFVVWRAITTTNQNAATYNNDPLFHENSTGDVWYTIFSAGGGTYKSTAGNWDTNEDKAQVNINLATDYVSVWQHTGGSVKNYLNSGTAGASTASGNTFNSNNTILLGKGYNAVAHYNGYMAAILFYAAAMGTNLSPIGAALAALYGITWS